MAQLNQDSLSQGVDRITPAERFEWIRQLYARVSSLRARWTRLLPEEFSPGFCVHLDDDFYPMFTCVPDCAPLMFNQRRQGLILYINLDPGNARSSFSHAYPKSLSDAVTQMDVLLERARGFIETRAKIVPGARVLINGVEETVHRIYRDAVDPDKFRSQVAIVGSRRRHPFSQVEPLQETTS